jgi:multidrug efflux pump subunit AcrA (membrane-fusion protein)
LDELTINAVYDVFIVAELGRIMPNMTLETKAPPPAQLVVPLTSKRPVRRKRRWVWWGGGALLIAVVLIGWWMHRMQTAMLAAATPTETAAVTRTTVEKSVESAGKVVSNLDVDIKCRAGGPVAKLPVDISQTVKTGDLLCQLDPTDEQLAVNVAEKTLDQSKAKRDQAILAYQQATLNLETTRSKAFAALESAKVKAANLQSKADRQKELVAQKLGSEEDYETAQTDAAAAKADAESAQQAVNELKQQELQLQSKKLDQETAEAQYESDKFNLDTQKQQLEYTTVISPMDGTVSALSVQIGSMVQSGVGGFSGGTTIMTLSDLSHIYVMATVDQSDIGGITLGQPARVEVDSFPNRAFVGKVVRIATTGVNTSNVVTFEVKVEVTDKDKSLLRPQMTGTVTIIEDSRKDVLAVPTAAVEHRAGQTFVKLSDGKEQQVKLGLDGGEIVEVISGLKDGDKVRMQTLELPTRWKASDR